MALVSGGLHLDGLADTVDALLAPDPARAELARRDPRIGAGGAAALILVLGTQVAALASLVGTAAAGGRPVPAPGSPPLTVVGRGRRCARGAGRRRRLLARAGAGRPARRLRRVVRGDRPAARRGHRRRRPWSLLVAVAAAVLASVGLVVGTVAGVGVGFVALAAIRRQRGGLDGDGLGAAIELTVAAILVAVAVVT